MPKNKKKAPIQGLKFSIKEENLLGIYADVVRISHGLHGFTLDFGQYIPEKNTFEILTRIKMSPTHAKSLLPALTENIRKYEGQFDVYRIGAVDRHHTVWSILGFFICCQPISRRIA